MRESGTNASAPPVLHRTKLESVRRDLTVSTVRSITPRMVRITLTGDDLNGFHSPSPDDHIKVSFPSAGNDVEKRDYTPRSFDADARLLSIEFALHEGGCGSAWAEQAKPGDRLQIGGPRGSTVISAPGASWLLIGDETALPAIGRRVEEMEAGTRVIAVIAVTGQEEEQRFQTKADFETRWVHRPDTLAADPEPFLKAISELEWPDGDVFVWVAAEGEVARAVRSCFVDTLKHPQEWIKASAYWAAGNAAK